MSRIIKIILSLFYYIFIEIKQLFAKLFSLKTAPRCVALYYHSIFDNEVSNFEKQIKLLKAKTEILPSNYSGKLAPGKIYSIITFDDGFENLIRNAIPILEKYKAPFTIFFITGYFGKTPGWDFPEYHKDQNERIMTVDQCKNLPKNLITYGSHTVNHKKLTQLNHDEINYELRESKKQLESILNNNVDILSFPNGEFNREIISKSFKAGYKRVFTIEPSFALSSENEKITNRVWTNGNDSYIEFWLKVHGGYCWLANAFKFKKKLLGIFK